MPQPLESGIDCHQRGDNLHAVVPTAAVNLPGNLVEVVSHAGELTKQRRRDRRKFAGAGGLLVQTRLPHPGCELLTVAAFQQTPVLIFRYPHREHFAAFVCQSGLLVTPGRAGNSFPIGLALGKPVYVCSKDMVANTVTVGEEGDLLAKGLIATDVNWLSGQVPTVPLEVRARTRYKQKEQKALVYAQGERELRLEFAFPQRAIAPGQAVVLYQGDIVVAGGTISKVLS